MFYGGDMVTRIRYFKNRIDNRLESKVIVSQKTGAKYRIRLYPDDMRFEIVNQGNGNIVKKGQSKTKDLRYLKERVRRVIKSMGIGVKLTTEIRRKSNV
jgi:hypothetical protein